MLSSNQGGKHSFNFENTLKSGFKNTGIFPHDPAVIRATVDLGLSRYDDGNTELPESSVVLGDDNESLKHIGQILEINEEMDSSTVAACQKALKTAASGGKTEIELIVEAHGRAFAAMKPKKQRVSKDHRLAVEKGRILLQDDFLKALDDRQTAEDAAKQGREVTVRKKSKSKPEVTSKKTSRKTTKKV